MIHRSLSTRHDLPAALLPCLQASIIGHDVGWANENEVGPDKPRARKVDLRMGLSNSEFGGARGIQM